MRWKNRSVMSKAAIILSVVLCLSIGLCGLGFVEANRGVNVSTVPLLGAIGCLVSICGLVLVLIVVLGKRIYKAIAGKEDSK